MAVSVSELAKALNLGPRRVQQLAREGVLPKPERGKYELGASMAAYIRHLQAALERRDLLDDDGDGVTVRRERARLLKAQADDAEISLTQRRGELIPIDVYTNEMAYMISTARAHLLNLPQRIAPLVAGEASVATVRHIIRDEVYASLRALSIPEKNLKPGDCPSCGQPNPKSVLGDDIDAAGAQAG